MEKSTNKKLWIVCGIPGSGKSTWIAQNRDFFEGTANVVSRDKIRFALLDDGDDYFGRENDVWTNFVKESKASLKLYENTILDATHITIGSRKKIFTALKNDLKDIEINALVFDVGLETALQRNENREGRAYVPVSAIRRMESQMVPPSANEGFTNIIYIRE